MSDDKTTHLHLTWKQAEALREWIHLGNPPQHLRVKGLNEVAEALESHRHRPKDVETQALPNVTMSEESLRALAKELRALAESMEWIGAEEGYETTQNVKQRLKALALGLDVRRKK
jgi:hypothetical protein